MVCLNRLILEFKQHFKYLDGLGLLDQRVNYLNTLKPEEIRSMYKCGAFSTNKMKGWHKKGKKKQPTMIKDVGIIILVLSRCLIYTPPINILS